MHIENNHASDVKIAYIGGGSRGWAWGLMSDLAQSEDISGQVTLYDIDLEAAKHNEIIGNKIKDGNSGWTYKAVETLREALTGANFVIISILPGTFDEMESDVHAPEAYGIYQSVGDTAGPGGIIRALRTIPMMEEIALAIKESCPEAWVINYTNPMTLCIASLYRAFPQIKAFGCCHEVFGVQNLLVDVLKDLRGIEGVKREDIKTTVTAVNHFTWITEAQYKNIDLFPLYREFVDKYKETGYRRGKDSEDVELNKAWMTREKVKFDLFDRYGYIAAAGDRHLAEFCPGDWYLQSPDQVVDVWSFGLTPVSYRKGDLKKRLERSERLLSGEESFTLNPTGEDGVKQIRALLGLCDLCTNVNLPNIGQIPNLPIGAVVETNAQFTANTVRPISPGALPATLLPLISQISANQSIVLEAAATRNLDMAFIAFSTDNLVRLSLSDAKKLFNTMVDNTAAYLTEYKR